MAAPKPPEIKTTGNKYKKVQSQVQAQVQGHEMDKFQREVLRRKRPIIADLLDFSPNSQKYYKDMGILKDEMLPEIMVSCSAHYYEKMSKN